MDINIQVTDAAQNYLANLLQKQDVDGIGVRIFITQPGTRYAETCLAYCRPGEEKETDQRLPLEKFMVYLDEPSVNYLDEAVVDFQEEKMGGQLTIKAPNAKMPRVTSDSPIEEQIKYILYTEINPGLASHGGEVSLEEFTEDSVAILKFGGGCQGCSAVDLTLKEGVEATLMERIPQIRGVRDVTDHSVRENAFYK
jgi:Fe/S biogenesis protein NfuA